MSFYHPIETLPHTIVDKHGVESYLRIKQRTTAKKWCVRYIRPNENYRGPRCKKRKYRAFYKTTLQVESRTLEGTVHKMFLAMAINGFTKEAGATLIHNNNHIM